MAAFVYSAAHCDPQDIAEMKLYQTAGFLGAFIACAFTCAEKTAFGQAPPAFESDTTAAAPTLDRSAGQVWKVYDIRSFTDRLRDQERPEQTMVDWILRETGTDIWFGDVQSVLSANAQRIVVYHTPSVQRVVGETIARFLNSRAEANEISVRLITIEKPDWRLRFANMLRPVKTTTPGVEAWLISRENAALLLSELSQRPDFREHNSPNLTIYNGQSHTLKSTRPRIFSTGQDPASASIAPANTRYIEEGFLLTISPLVCRDGRSMEAVIKCSVDQIEKFTPVVSNGVDQFGMQRRSQIQVPQISSWRLHERFRWPRDEVLLVSRGQVATPLRTTKWNEPLRKMLNNGGQRANALLFLESRSEVRTVRRDMRTAGRTDAANYRGRY